MVRKVRKFVFRSSVFVSNFQVLFSLKKAICLVSESFSIKAKVRRSVFVINCESEFSLKRKATCLISETLSIKAKSEGRFL